jgi:hypothetical protein
MVMAEERTPATRAASGLPPMARMNKPSAVRDSERCKAAHIVPAIHKATGRPRKKPLPSLKYGA